MTAQQSLNVFCCLQLDRIARIGYARSIASSLPASSLISQAARPPATLGEKERSAGPVKIRTEHQIRLKSESNRRQRERKQREKLQQMALALSEES